GRHGGGRGHERGPGPWGRTTGAMLPPGPVCFQRKKGAPGRRPLESLNPLRGTPASRTPGESCSQAFTKTAGVLGSAARIAAFTLAFLLSKERKPKERSSPHSKVRRLSRGASSAGPAPAGPALAVRRGLSSHIRRAG